MIRKTQLPNGRYTDDLDAAAAAWIELYQPIVSALGWTVVSYGPAIKFKTSDGETCDITVRQAKQLGEALSSARSKKRKAEP